MYNAMGDVFGETGEDQKKLGIKFGDKKTVVLRVISCSFGDLKCKGERLDF